MKLCPCLWIILEQCTCSTEMDSYSSLNYNIFKLTYFNQVSDWRKKKKIRSHETRKVRVYRYESAFKERNLKVKSLKYRDSIPSQYLSNGEVINHWASYLMWTMMGVLAGTVNLLSLTSILESGSSVTM